MSTKSALSERFGPRVQIRDEAPVPDGSAERLSLRRRPNADLNTPAAARALLRRHLAPKAAHALMSELFDSGLAYVEVPKVEDLGRLLVDLAECGVEARRHGPEPISVRQVRETLGLSQMQFALRFGLEEATVRNWEQGKSRPNATAMTLLWTILRHPDAVTRSIERGERADARAATE